MLGGIDYAMKIQKRSLIALVVLAVVLVLPLAILAISNVFAARATRAKRTKTFTAQRAIFAKLEAYEKDHGHYPESLDALSFTNTPAERELLSEVKKFQYRIDERGNFDLAYDSDGLRMGPGVTRYEAQPDASANGASPRR